VGVESLSLGHLEELASILEAEQEAGKRDTLPGGKRQVKCPASITGSAAKKVKIKRGV